MDLGAATAETSVSPRLARQARARADEASVDPRTVDRARSVLARLGFPLVAVAVVYRMTGRFVVVHGELANGFGREALRIASDPVIASARRGLKPISWMTLRSHRIDEAERMGLRYGLTVPVHGPRGLMVLVTIAGRGFVGHQEAIDVPMKLREIGMEVLYGVSVSDDKGAMRTRSLTSVQRETIRLLARGLRIEDVARMSGVSSNAIVKRIEGAKDLFGTRSITELVARALVAGELGVLNFDGL